MSSILSDKNLLDAPDWHAWLDENLARGCDLATLERTLLEHRFSRASIEHGVALYMQRANERGHTPVRDAAALLKPDNGRFVLKANTAKLELLMIEDFLSAEECTALAGAGDTRLRPSDITMPSPDKYFRTSRTCDLGLMDDPIVRTVSDRICATLGIPQPYAEVMQLQKYEVGQEFKGHTDYFEPNTEEYTKFCQGMGNRTWTFMIYLTNVDEGGGTRFFAVDKTIVPRLGMAVIWNNLRRDGTPNPYTAHAGTPVIRGTKCIVTQWFREFPIAPAVPAV